MVCCLGMVIATQAYGHPVDTAQQSAFPLWLERVPLAFFWSAYIWGSVRVWPGWGKAALFHSGGLLAAAALIGPLDRLAESNAAAHMIQHMLMMVAIAPLWVLAQPLPQLANAARWITGLWTPLLRLARYPVAAAVVHGLVIWFWHAPRLYILALENPWWHLVEHASFLLTAGIFWWAVLRSSRRAGPAALLALLFTLMHTGFLGALLTFASGSLYGEGRDLLSQQLAGLTMWVVGGIPYLVAALWTGSRWFQQITHSSNNA